MYSRREFILGIGLLIGACKSTPKEKPAPVVKEDADPNDSQKRKQLGYVDKTPIPESHCSNCGLYLPKEGGCQLFKGPVNANGYCTYWVAVGS